MYKVMVTINCQLQWSCLGNARNNSGLIVIPPAPHCTSLLHDELIAKSITGAM